VRGHHQQRPDEQLQLRPGQGVELQVELLLEQVREQILEHPHLDSSGVEGH